MICWNSTSPLSVPCMQMQLISACWQASVVHFCMSCIYSYLLLHFPTTLPPNSSWLFYFCPIPWAYNTLSSTTYSILSLITPPWSSRSPGLFCGWTGIWTRSLMFQSNTLYLFHFYEHWNKGKKLATLGKCIGKQASKLISTKIPN